MLTSLPGEIEPTAKILNRTITTVDDVSLQQYNKTRLNEITESFKCGKVAKENISSSTLEFNLQHNMK